MARINIHALMSGEFLQDENVIKVRKSFFINEQEKFKDIIPSLTSNYKNIPTGYNVIIRNNKGYSIVAENDNHNVENSLVVHLSQ